MFSCLFVFSFVYSLMPTILAFVAPFEADNGNGNAKHKHYCWLTCWKVLHVACCMLDAASCFDWKLCFYWCWCSKLWNLLWKLNYYFNFKFCWSHCDRDIYSNYRVFWFNFIFQFVIFHWIYNPIIRTYCLMQFLVVQIFDKVNVMLVKNVFFHLNKK